MFEKVRSWKVWESEGESEKGDMNKTNTNPRNV